jgi:ferrous iron transport protein A
MKLSEAKKNSSVIIDQVLESDVTLKLFEFGFLPGAEMTVVNKAPFNGPIYVSIDGSLISLRKAEAETVILK